MGIGSRTGVPLKGPEYDALTRFRKYVRWRPGERKAAKTSFNRRVRHRQIDLEDDAGSGDARSDIRRQPN